MRAQQGDGVRATTTTKATTTTITTTHTPFLALLEMSLLGLVARSMPLPTPARAQPPGCLIRQLPYMAGTSRTGSTRSVSWARCAYSNASNSSSSGRRENTVSKLHHLLSRTTHEPSTADTRFHSLAVLRESHNNSGYTVQVRGSDADARLRRRPPPLKFHRPLRRR